MTSITDDNPPNAFNSNSAADGFSVSGLRQSKKDGQYSFGNGGSEYLVHRQSTSQADSAAGTGMTGTSASANTRVNGFRKSPPTTSLHRPRTLSQPYATPNINEGTRQPTKANLDDHVSLGSRSPRLVDAKPTRIPKASRRRSGTTVDASSPVVPFTGASSDVSHLKHSCKTDIRAYHFPTSHSAQGIPQHTTARLVNEPAPFNTASSTSTIYNIIEADELGYNASGPMRNSIDSTEERPFEHWYRGENSRNGGVGELRVGRRQEMLDIANYGHAMHSKHKLLANRQATLTLEDTRRTSWRKRAESIASFRFSRSGLRERGSLYLEDDIIMDRIERVLDEDPLTDLEGEEGSDVVSTSTKGQHDRRPSRYSNHDADFILGVGDVTLATAVVTESSLPQGAVLYEVEEPISQTLRQQYTTTMQPRIPVQSASSITTLQPLVQNDASIIVPPQCSPSTSPTPRSRSRQSGSSSRIPTYERRSSESRTSASQHSSNTTKVGHPVSAVDLSVSPTPSPPLLPSGIATTSSPARTSAAPTSIPKRGTSPNLHGKPSSTTKKSQPAKTKPKSKPPIKKHMKEDNRQSVARYPTLDGEADDLDMSDAIPYWTQPKIVGGNWDDVRQLFLLRSIEFVAISCPCLRYVSILLSIGASVSAVLSVFLSYDGLNLFWRGIRWITGCSTGRGTEERLGWSLRKSRWKSTAKEKTGSAYSTGAPFCCGILCTQTWVILVFHQAPGTFGYDGSKVRRKGKGIDMDEFGRSPSAANGTPDVLEEVEPSQLISEDAPKAEVSVAHDNICAPMKSPPSPPPFSQYAPTTTKHLTHSAGAVRNDQQVVLEQDEKGAGCCKCIVMWDNICRFGFESWYLRR